MVVKATLLYFTSATSCNLIVIPNLGKGCMVGHWQNGYEWIFESYNVTTNIIITPKHAIATM